MVFFLPVSQVSWEKTNIVKYINHYVNSKRSHQILALYLLVVKLLVSSCFKWNQDQQAPLKRLQGERYEKVTCGLQRLVEKGWETCILILILIILTVWLSPYPAPRSRAPASLCSKETLAVSTFGFIWVLYLSGGRVHLWIIERESSRVVIDRVVHLA